LGLHDDRWTFLVRAILCDGMRWIRQDLRPHNMLN
jgi:hypothetical protein